MNEHCQQIDAFLNGELDSDANESFEDHLACCEGCRAEVDIAADLDSRLREAWSMIAAPEQLQSRPEPIQKPKTLPGYYRWGGTVLAIAASVGLLISIANRMGGPIDQRSMAVSESDSDKRDTVDSSLSVRQQEVALVRVLEPQDGSRVKTVFTQRPRVSSEFTIVNAYAVGGPDVSIDDIYSK